MRVSFELSSRGVCPGGHVDEAQASHRQKASASINVKKRAAHKQKSDTVFEAKS
jgi:hypothetical protein